MIIKTKYNVGDWVWFMKNDIITQYDIESITVFTSKGRHDILYQITIDRDKRPENKIFPSSEKLIEDLIAGKYEAGVRYTSSGKEVHPGDKDYHDT